MKKYKTVDDYLADLDDLRREQVSVLRQYILETCPPLIEHIKWNAPSYVLDGQDRITVNTLNKDTVVKLVFHMGATRKEDKKAEPILPNAELMQWVSDIRGYAVFTSLDDIISHEKAVKQTVVDWLAL